MLGQASGGSTPPLDAIEWVRETVQEQVEVLVGGMADRIDALKTGAGVKGARGRLEPVAFAAKRDVDIELTKVEIRARLVHPTVPEPGPTADYDVFISHASEDKADVAEPLAAALQQRGFRVWLDKYEMRIGDRILTAIDNGLARSRFGVVIVSPAFFGKAWTQMELNALAALEANAGDKRILPVWHNVTAADVAAKSPLLVAVRAATTKNGVEAIADEIAAVLREAR